MAEALNHFKKDYRARFCHGGGKQIDVRPGQNILKIIQDCFENCGSDFTINSPSTTRCSTPVVRNRKETSIQSEKPNAGLSNSVKNACNFVDSLTASPPQPVINTSKGWSLESHLEPAIHDHISDANKIESPVSKGERSNKNITTDINDLVGSPGKTSNILKDVEALCRSPTSFSVSEGDHEAVGSPLLVEEAISSPVHILHFDEQSTPAAVKSHEESENLRGPQTGKDEQLVLVRGTDHIVISSVQKRKSSFSSAFLAAVRTGTLGKRYSASMLPPSPPPVKDQDLEIQNECEFLIDESDGVSFNSWFSIPQRNKKSKKDGSAITALKSQSSERQKTESKKSKNRKVQVEAPDKQQMHDLDVRVQPDFKITSESEMVSSDRDGNVLKQGQSNSHMEKTKKEALRRDSPKQRKGTSWKPEDEELLLSLSELGTKASNAERCKKRVMTSEDSSVPSAGDQQEQSLWPKKNLKSSNYMQSTLRTSQHLVHKKQNVKQKLSKDTVSKKLAESARKKMKAFSRKGSDRKPLLPTMESSESEPGEEGLERDSAKLNGVFPSPLHLKLQTSKIRNLANSEKRNVLPSLESLGGTNNKTPVKAKELQQNLTKTVQNSEKRSSKSPRKIPEEIHHRARRSMCSDSEDTEPQNTTDFESSSVQDMVEKKAKLSNVKIKRNKRKHNMQHRSQDFSASEKAMSCRSGPLLEHDVKFTSKRKSIACKQDNSSSDNSEDLNFQINDLLSNKIARHKIVMPSNTPNVRRTKRIRLRPLEYWRGERVNYTMRPSGLVISGIVCPETEPRRKIKRKKHGHKQKGDQPRSEIAVNLDQTLADTSKPTVVLDSITNKEVLLECINTGNRHSCFFKDQSVEIYKNLNTFDFAMGKLILKPLKEKGHQFVHMDTIAFYVIQGKIVLTLHKTSYYLTTGNFFYVPAGNGYNIQNILNEESILLFTQLKGDRPKAGEEMLETSSP